MSKTLDELSRGLEMIAALHEEIANPVKHMQFVMIVALMRNNIKDLDKEISTATLREDQHAEQVDVPHHSPQSHPLASIPLLAL